MLFKLINKHICLLINNTDYFIVDTGLPFSFSLENDFISKEFELKANPRLNHLINAKIILDGIRPRGIIGLDMMKKGLYLKFFEGSQNEGEIYFYSKNIEDSQKIVLSKNNSYPLIGFVKLDETEINAIIDTGAFIPYTIYNFIQGKNSLEKKNDYIGRLDKVIETDLYLTKLKINEKTYDLLAGYNQRIEQDLKVCNASLIFSPISLGINELNIDFERNILQFK